MALLRSNAVVSTTRAGSAVLTGIGVMIGRPGPTNDPGEGGISRYVVLFPPGSDVRVRDGLTIVSWGQNSVNSAEVLRIFEASPSGGFGLEVVRALVGEWIGG